MNIISKETYINIWKNNKIRILSEQGMDRDKIFQIINITDALKSELYDEFNEKMRFWGYPNQKS